MSLTHFPVMVLFGVSSIFGETPKPKDEMAKMSFTLKIPRTKSAQPSCHPSSFSSYCCRCAHPSSSSSYDHHAHPSSSSSSSSYDQTIVHIILPLPMPFFFLFLFLRPFIFLSYGGSSSCHHSCSWWFLAVLLLPLLLTLL